MSNGPSASLVLKPWIKSKDLQICTKRCINFLFYLQWQYLELSCQAHTKSLLQRVVAYGKKKWNDHVEGQLVQAIINFAAAIWQYFLQHSYFTETGKLSALSYCNLSIMFPTCSKFERDKCTELHVKKLQA